MQKLSPGSAEAAVATPVKLCQVELGSVWGGAGVCNRGAIVA